MARSRATVAAALDSLRREVDTDLYRQSVATADRLKGWLEAPQRDVIDDPWQRKAMRTARQVGKTTTAVAYIADVCLRKKDAVVVGIELTLKTAKGLLWKPLKKLSRDYSFGVAFHNTDLIATFAGTNATCIIGGAETEADIEKYRGLTADLFIVDEAKSFPSRLLDSLIAEIIQPALLHRKGSLLMMGTPGTVFSGTFFEATGPDSSRVQRIGDEQWVKARPYRERRAARWRGVNFEWSFHTWGFGDLKGKWAREAEAEAAKIIREKGYSVDNPIRRREFDGEWTPDDAKAVYRFDASTNTWTPGRKTDENPFGLPEGHQWRYVIGVDLGWADPFAVQIAAYSDTHPALYQCGEYEATELKVSAQAALLGQAVADCGGLENVEAIVGDFDGGAAKAIQETLAEEYELPVEMASKREKRDHIELLNSDLLEGRAFVMRGSRLADEMAHLQWDEKRPDKEKASLSNHHCDAFVYLWRKARHHEAKPAASKPVEGSKEAREERLRAAMREHHERQKARAQPDDDDTTVTGWNTDGGLDEW